MIVSLNASSYPADIRSSARLSNRTFTRGSPKRPRNRPSVFSSTSWRMRSSGRLRALAILGTWNSAAPGEMCGSRPLADVVTRSDGTGAEGFSFFRASMSPCTRSISALLEGPRFDPPEFAALYGAATVLVASLGSGAVVADGRPWKYLSAVKAWPISSEPTTLPSRSIRLPWAWRGKITPAMPVMTSG